MAAPITPSKGCSPITPPKQSSPITPPKGSVPQTPPKAGSDTESDWGTWRSKPASGKATTEEASVPTAGGKATMVQTSVPAKGGKAAPCVPRVSVRPVFTHPPLPKEKQAKLEQSRASFAQRVSEARAKAAGPKKRSADTPYTPDLGTVSEQQQEFEEHEQRMRSHYGVLATLRVAARERRQGLLLSARDHVASAVAASGLPETANLTESDCSDTTEWWRNRVRGATSIEEINRLQVNFRKLKQLEEESAVIVSSGSEEEWEQDSAARVEYFRGKVLRMFDEASRVATSSGVGSEEHGESSSPTVDVLVNPTSEYVGYWSPATTSEPTPGAEMAPQTPSPPGVIDPGAEFIPETPPPSGMMASGATGSLAAKAVLEKAAAKALLESLVREQERQDREQERQQLEGPPKGPPKFPPRFLAPTPKVRSIASKTSDPKPSRKASVPKPSKKAGTPEPVPAATSAPEPEPVQPKRRLPPPRAVAYGSDCQAGVYVAISTTASSAYLPDAESGADVGAPNAAADANARGDASRCATARGDAAGCASASDGAAWGSTASDDAAGDVASRYDATTDGHDDAYVSYYARLFARTASRWTVPLLPTSFVRKCNRKVKRLKIRRGWRFTKDGLKVGSCMYVVSRNKVSVLCVVGWRVVEVQGSKVLTERCVGEREKETRHVLSCLSCCRSAGAHGRHVLSCLSCCRSACVHGRHVLSCLSCCRSAGAHGRHVLSCLSCCRSACAQGRHVLSCLSRCRSACAHVRHVVSGCRVKLSFRVSCTWVSGSGRGKDAQIEGESRLACVGEKVDGDDVVNPEPHLIRAMRHRGLPVVDLEDEEELIPDPESAGAGDVVEQEGQEEQEGTGDLYVPLSDDQYVEHVARGHQPYLPSCSLCVSSRGVIPARRRKDPQIPQASFLSDFLFFTKDLRVCLIQHELSGYLVGIPYALCHR